MKRWFTLLRVELSKLVTRKLTWVLLILMIILPIFSVGMTKLTRSVFEETTTVIDEETGEVTTERTPLDISEPELITREDVERTLRETRDQFAVSKLLPNFDPKSSSALNSEAKITALEGHLDREIYEFAGRDNLHKASFNGAPFNSVLIALTIILAISIAGEFNAGTMKQMFTRPFSRTQILTAKFMAAQLFALLLLIVHYVVFMVAYGVVFGFDLSNPASVFVWDSSAVFLGIAQHTIVLHLFAWLSLWLIGAMAMAFAVWTRSTAAVISLTVALCFLAAPIINALTDLATWLTFLPFPYFDVRPAVKMGTTAIEGARMDVMGMVFGTGGTTMAHGLTSTPLMIGWLVYFVLFFALSVIGFRKRDI